MHNQELIEYIKNQLSNNVEKQAIEKILLEHHYTQQQVDEAFGYIALQSQPVHKKSKLKFFVILLSLFVLLGVGALIFYSLKRDSVPVSTENQSNQVVTVDCKQYYDIGYIKGLNRKDINDNTGLPNDVPSECEEEHEKGYFAAIASRETYEYDSTRQKDLFDIANAIYQYAVSNNGNLPKGITNESQEMGKGSGKLDLSGDILPYLKTAFPYDPEVGSEESTGYTIYRSLEGRIILEAKSSRDPSSKVTVTR